MAAYEGDDSFEHTLLIVREVYLYKIPPRAFSGGYKCSEWLISDRIWSGRLRLVSVKNLCEIRLEDSSSGELFAACPVQPGNRDASVESVLDSSRYFVIKVDDGQGHHAFLGLGFTERNEAFDFNVALSDHEKHIFREQEEKGGEEEKTSASAKSSHDYRLKEGETIRINVKTKPSTSATGKKLSGTNPSNISSMASVGAMKAPLAPPPGGLRIRQPLPPPKFDPPKAESAVSENKKSEKSTESTFDLSSLEKSLPGNDNSGGKVAKESPIAAGWAAF